MASKLIGVEWSLKTKPRESKSEINSKKEIRKKLT
jgi:hypothetical protein